MKIRLAILESDSNYLYKLTNVFNAKYSDRFTVFSFTDQDIALKSLLKERIDVFIASDMFEIDVESLPKQCVFAYFVNSTDIESTNNQKAICRFQKVEVIYREIYDLYSEKGENLSTFKYDTDVKVIGFMSPCGGVGTSTLACACATRYAKMGSKVLYLNLEKFGSADAFLLAEGNYNMSDVIFSLKSKKTKIAFKLESCVKKDKNGVSFFSKTRFALDMLELKHEDIGVLLHELKKTGQYEYIIVDLDFSLEEEFLKNCNDFDNIVWVSSGTASANDKVYRAFQAFQTLEEQMDLSITRKLMLVYNMFRKNTCETIDESLGVLCLGGLPYYANLSLDEMLEEFVQKPIFDSMKS